MEKIKITDLTGKTLSGTIMYPEGIEPNGKAVLFIHGWRSNQVGYIKRAKALAELGYICFVFDFRGHGESSGDIRKLTRQEFLADAMEAYDYLKNQEGVNPDKIGVFGSSFGGYIATLLTKKRPVRWLALRVPANYPDKGINDIPQNEYPREGTGTKEWRQQELRYGDTVALRALHEYPHEVLLIESEKDNVIPHQAIQINAVKDKSNLTYVVMEGIGHSLESEQSDQKFIQILTRWFGDKN